MYYTYRVKFRVERRMKEIRKNFTIPKELMDMYAQVLKELQRGFSEDIKLLIRMRIVSSGTISLEDKKKILAEIEKEVKKK